MPTRSPNEWNAWEANGYGSEKIQGTLRASKTPSYALLPLVKKLEVTAIT